MREEEQERKLVKPHRGVHCLPLAWHVANGRGRLIVVGHSFLFGKEKVVGPKKSECNARAMFGIGLTGAAQVLVQQNDLNVSDAGSASLQTGENSSPADARTPPRNDGDSYC
jgi:hypothetical protein